MPRTPMPPAEDVAVPLNRTALAADSQALTVLAQRSAQVSAAYDDGQPYDRARVIAAARFYGQAAAEAMLELGKCLVALKENEAHGDFIEILEKRLSIAPRTAQKLMQAAVKYLAPQLASKPNAPQLLALGKSKLLELVSEPDDDLEGLADGGTVAGLTLSDIEAMSARELRAALQAERDARRKEASAKDRVISKKEASITALEMQLAQRESADEQSQLDQVRDTALQAEQGLMALAEAASHVMGGPATEAASTAAHHAVAYVAQRLADLINAHGLQVDLQELVTPHWLTQAAEAPARKAKA